MSTSARFALWWIHRREPTRRGFSRNSPLAQPTLQELAKGRIVLDHAVDQIVLLFQRNQLKRGLTIDRHYYRLMVTLLTKRLNLGLASLSGTTFMASKPVALHAKRISLLFSDKHD